MPHSCGRLLQHVEAPGSVRVGGAAQLAWCTTTGLWTLGRIGKLIETLTGQRYCKSGVWRLLKRLGFSSQRLAKRAMQRDEAAVWQWKTKRWPAGVHR